MKYLINHRVINADQIKQVLYVPADEEVDEKSSCLIDVGCTNNENDWDIVLGGVEADRFWKVYSGDALDVMKEAQS